MQKDLQTIDQVEEEYQTILPNQIKTIAFAMKIIAIEIYFVTSPKLNAKLKKVLQDIGKGGRLKYWSGYVKDSLISEAEQAKTSEENLVENPTLQLLVSWKNLIVTSASVGVEEFQLNDSLKEVIIVDLIEGLKSMVSGTTTALKTKIAQIASALIFTLTKFWTSSFSNQSRIVKELEECLKMTLSSSETLVPPVQIGLTGSMTAVLQYSRSGSGLGTDTMNMVIPTICSVLLQSSRELPTTQELSSQNALVSSQSPTDTSSSDVRVKLQMITCCLLEELILQCSRCDMWLTVVQEHLILPTLLASIEMFIQAHQGIQYIHTVMLLLLTIAREEKGAEALAMSGLTQRTCLSAMSLYKDEDFFPKPALKPRNDKQLQTEQVTWHGIYCMCIELYAVVLAALKYSFLEDALNFVGVHQERLQKCLELSRISLSAPCIQEAEKTCNFIYQLSHFIREWRLHLCDSLNKLQMSTLYMSQTFIAFLMRPRYLQYVIEQQQQKRSVPAHRRLSESPKQPRLQQQSSTEDIDSPSQQLVQIQQSMLLILGRSLSSLRHFTPDLCEIMYDKSIDFNEYEPFLAMGFSGPSTDQDSPPSFGTLTSCVRDVCVRFLGKIEPRGSVSPQRVSDISNVQSISKTLVLFVMENALYIIMSQAMRYLRDPNLPPSDKQLLKRELGTEMNYFLMELQRYLKRGPPTSPSSLRLPSPRGPQVLGRSISQSAFSSGQETEYFKFVQEFVSQVLK
ncbi:hypothetical protein KUTeg_021451 [Tegillarca granosa]|uniref:Uncharacterized protein n=1 Tax=Tegillarca granosa TaxID=220873 RepID=A0ABQ9E3T0_TEGGR|nr:hypothetical protein KUTeg_021451 [Tegillarca granosa]